MTYDTRRFGCQALRVASVGGWFESGRRVVIAGDIFDVAFGLLETCGFLAEVVDFFAGDFGFAFALVAFFATGFFAGAFFAVGFFAVAFFATGFVFAMIFLLWIFSFKK